ncbi:MAG: anaerobic ribonucleoside-triphosphate reductase activating protein [Clostridia bacterium]|nr:anaerobic ribonucleoside-triphosphate reductase activating protein [Clostridia bacterium]
MHYAKINKCDIANGEGIRVSLFVSGCRNRCRGCFQPETWDFNYGNEFSENAAEEIFSAVENPSVRGLTILGGEPMEPENQKEILPFLLEFKSRFPEKTVWLYTGNTYEELIGEHRNHTEHIEELLSLIDILVDGRFVEEEKRLGLRFRGSNNQRIIDMQDTLKQGKIILWKGMMEDRKYESKN